MSDHKDSEDARQVEDALATIKNRENTKNVTKDSADNVTSMTVASKIEHITFDIDEISLFLTTVFHALNRDDPHEYVLTNDRLYGYPKSTARLLQDLYGNRGGPKRGKPLYYALSTVHPTNNQLRNLQTAFAALHVVMLDDIGTKIPVDKITLHPSYIVESSEGNFQYGYVLRDPITDYRVAEALIHQIGEAGLSDAGGCLVNKYARLPGGIHGKKNSEDINFLTHLHELNTNQYTIDELLSGFDLPLTENDLRENPEAYLKSRSSARLYADKPARFIAADGYVDPVTEVLADDHKLFNEGGEWLTIECPWHDRHTDGNKEAFYSPLGYGEGEYKSRRGFKCFHDHCKTRKTTDFLAHIGKHYGLKLPVFDPCPSLLTRYVYDAKADGVWDIAGAHPEMLDSLKALRNTERESFSVPSYENANMELKWIHLKSADLWLSHPQRLSVLGAISDPSQHQRFVQFEGHQRINLFSMPDYASVQLDMTLLEPFFEFLTYLIPDSDERELFIDMLAAKMQNMGFRGWGVLMIAPQQRTGRGTLMNILEHLYGEWNAITESYNKITGDIKFNTFQASPLVFAGEIEQALDSGEKHKVYNQLKELVDPTEKTVIINPKFGRQYRAKSCSMYIFMTNHKASEFVHPDDKRIFIIKNVEQRRGDKYFKQFRQDFVDARDEHGIAPWRDHLHAFLMQREVDIGRLNGSAPDSSIKQEVIADSKRGFDAAFEWFLQNLPSGFIPVQLTQDVFTHPAVMDALDLHRRRGNLNDFLRSQFQTCTEFMDPKITIQIDGKRTRLRIYRRTDIPEETPAVYDAFYTKKPSQQELKLRRRTNIRALWKDYDMHTFIRNMLEALHTDGIISKPDLTQFPVSVKQSSR